MKIKLPILLLGIVAALFIFNEYDSKNQELTSSEAWEKQIAEKRAAKKAGSHKYDGPDEFAKFQKGIRTQDGAQGPEYPSNYTLKELGKAKARLAALPSNAKVSATNAITWAERGPANVPGRTRAMVVMPQDASHNTWVIGSVGGGIWKTTDGGTLWIEKTKDLPNIAFTTIDLAASNPNVLYAGTGEGGLGGLDGIGGNGVFKSIDGGETWSQLSFTSGNEDFQNINRLIVDPTDENVLLICNSYGNGFNTGIFKSVDGGTTWSNKISLSNSDTRGFQQIIATPSNFNVQYATFNGVGVYKSIDAGETWNLSNMGMSPAGRIEMAVSPVNANRLFASAEGSIAEPGPNLNVASDFYISSDAGASWSLVDVSFNSTAANYLRDQGWYNNTILCSPYNEDIVYVGGISMLKVELGSGAATITTTINVEENATNSFLDFVSFSASQFGGKLEVLDGNNPASDTLSVEVRFGPGLSQKAHRFNVPANGGTNNDGGAGVPDADYTYADYIDVPFEVWDVETNRQLMVSFRDQQDDGLFNLNPRDDTNDPNLLTAREYIFISNIDYSATADANISTVSAGHLFENMYFFWPVLTAGGSWDPANLPASSLNIIVSEIAVLDANVAVAADPYGDFDGTNSFNTFGVDVHPDQHGLVAIKEDEAAKTFRILLVNDGGPFISKVSTDPGVTEGDWAMVGNTYNTGQFYGADKKPGEDVYWGGMQDNGTWQSPSGADASSDYSFKIDGDGFEVLWHNQDPDKLIGGAQRNSFQRSINGGTTFSDAVSGLSGDHPFISKLSTSKMLPDVIYTVSSAGVFKSDNFGQNWNLTAITDQWGGANNFLDVEVSRANPNIIWAGSGNSTSSDRRIFVSTDQGASFAPSSFSDLVGGTITKLSSHPTEPNTAYMIFSFAKSPKILKTEDLGQTWVDISGFGTNTVSSNGFPDVAVYCLYVFRDDVNKMWAGTDIGIVESLDAGATWNLLANDMPNVAVWDMKGQDDQIVIATHGRGIWTATVDNSQTIFKEGPSISAFGTSPQQDFVLSITAVEVYDSTQVFVNSELSGTIYDVAVGDATISIPNIAAGNKAVKLVSYTAGNPVFTNSQDFEHLSLKTSSVEEHSDNFNNASNLILDGLSISGFGSNNDFALQSPHNYGLDTELIAIISQPIIVSGTNSIFYYSDIAVVEPADGGTSFGEVAFNDYVVVEATKDGLNWMPIEDGYNASANANWEAAFNGSSEINSALFVDHSIDLTNNYAVGDTLLFRFRLLSNSDTFAWGWVIDDIYIQTEPLGLEKPSEVSSYKIYPVPSNGKFTMDYQLIAKSEVSLEIMSITGQKIKAYDLGQKTSGNYRFKLENYNLENGVYIFSLRTNSGVISQRVLISK